MKATTKDLRLHTSSLLAAVDRGETVVITYRGKCRAVLRRWEEPQGAVAEGLHNPAFGIWADLDEEPDVYVRRLRQPRTQP